MMYTVNGIAYNVDTNTHEEWVRSERYEYCEDFNAVRVNGKRNIMAGVKRLERLVSFFLF